MKKEATDTIKDIMLELRKAQGADMQDTDVITRYEMATGSLVIRTSGCSIWSQGIGSSFILGHGLTGSIVNPVTHLKMNDNAANTTITDSMGYQNGTSYDNTNTISNTGKIGSSLRVNTTGSYFNLGNYSTPFSDKIYSWGCWVKPLSYHTSVAQQQYICYRRDDVPSIYTKDDVNGIPQFIYFVTDLQYASASISGNDWLNNWNHVFMTYNGSTIKGYINGSLINSVPATTTHYLTSQPVYIGNDGVIDRYLNADFDDFRIYDFVLTDAQVNLIYNESNGTEDQNPTWYSGNGILGSSTIYNHPPHYLGDYRTGSSLIYSGGYP